MQSLEGALTNEKYTVLYNGAKFSINDQIQLELHYSYYTGNLGDSDSNQASGTYVFRPGLPHNISAPLCTFGSFKVLKTSLLEWVMLKCELSGYTKLSLWRNSDKAEPEFTHFLRPIADTRGIEVVVQYHNNWQTHGQFFTDSNEFEPIVRTVDTLGGESYQPLEPVSGNYYPVTSYIGIEASAVASIFTDRTQGGTVFTQEKGSTIEVMLVRRCLKDDGKGIAAPLREMEMDGSSLKLITKHVFALTSTREKVKSVQGPLEHSLSILYGIGEVSENPSRYYLDKN